MEVEEQEPERLCGWFVTEVGRRTAQPFVNLADPESGREQRLYIDTHFSVSPDRVHVHQHGDEVFSALDGLRGLWVAAARATPDPLDIDFDDGPRLTVGLANEQTGGSPWWVGKFQE